MTSTNWIHVEDGVLSLMGLSVANREEYLKVLNQFDFFASLISN